ncbi:Eukaryotic/viral aspartic protease [Phytophthora megakarya]|uniref:Eukaryotic/viral aspartic protease n=1 Tax=Phytophthora megakarya TaxID=4795 RepID=A0A225UQN5_9STRA|nr:Eukaryotic/viral aspartic protease [Phytophthora megakarya]
MAKGSSMAVSATPARSGGHDDFETPGKDDLVTTERTVSFSDSVFDPDAQDEDEYVHDDTEDKAPVQEPDLPEDAEITEQVTADTVSLLTAMGMATHAYPSKIALADWSLTEAGAELQKWKKKLKAAFGSQGVGLLANVPLPQTPKKVTKNVFASGEQSPYFQDSHMITPRSANRQRRLVSEIQHEEHTANTHQGTSRRSTARTTRDDSSSDDDDDPFDFYGDQTTELAQQIRELTDMEVMNSTPSIFELLQHRQLTQINPFRGRLDESENSMQWLRGFVYEMKGTHTPPNEWCVAFQLSLRDGAVHWHRALSRKTKRTWSLLSDKFISYYCSQFSQSASTRYYRAKRMEKENIRDYLNRLNGYARNANIKFENTPGSM